MTERSLRILVLGATGMLGSAMLRELSDSPGLEVLGSARSASSLKFLNDRVRARVIAGVDVESMDALTRLFSDARPDVVINCIGLVKQLAEAEDPLLTIPINSLLPHKLAKLCHLSGSRLVHMSTDCVFSGAKGMYTEGDTADARDLYGLSKHLGEVHGHHAITLRTSIIGHELDGCRSLVGWFLAQEGSVKGYRRAIFSGLPTVEMARIVRDFVLPRPDLSGVYHVSAEPIDKFTLLTRIAAEYGRTNPIEADDSVVIDRSLNSVRFRAATGFNPKPWPELVRSMREFG